VHYPDKCFPGRNAFEYEFDIVLQLPEILCLTNPEAVRTIWIGKLSEKDGIEEN
jgi:hypothetical protein